MASVTVNPVKGEKFQLKIKSGKHTIVCDQPTAVGGSDGGPGPKDFLLASLGACTAQTILLNAPKRKWDITKLTVTVSLSYPDGDNGKPVFDKKIEVEGNLTADELEAIKKMAARCPVYRIFMEEKTFNTSIVKN